MARLGYLEAKFQLERALVWMAGSEENAASLEEMMESKGYPEELKEIHRGDSKRALAENRKTLEEAQAAFEKFNVKASKPARTCFEMKLQLLVSMNNDLYYAATLRAQKDAISMSELVRRSLKGYLYEESIG